MNEETIIGRLMISFPYFFLLGCAIYLVYHFLEGHKYLNVKGKNPEKRFKILKFRLHYFIIYESWIFGDYYIKYDDNDGEYQKTTKRGKGIRYATLENAKDGIKLMIRHNSENGEIVE